MKMVDIKSLIRDVKDFPKQGIVFKDITTLLKDPAALKLAADLLYEMSRSAGITKVAGIESRGFILGGLLAERLGVGFVPIRKPKKLPAPVISAEYSLEYGTDKIEMHVDAIETGDRVLLHDDLLATGGTAKAACELIEKAGGTVAMLSFIIELTFLSGREKLKDHDVRSLISYSSE
jgi:adenine phosphoribosyltransferase